MTSPFDDIFSGAPLMAILRGMGVERSIALATTAWDLGIDSVEVPLQTAEDEIAHGRSPVLLEFAQMVLRTREAQLTVLLDATAAVPATTRASSASAPSA